MEVWLMIFGVLVLVGIISQIHHRITRGYWYYKTDETHTRNYYGKGRFEDDRTSYNEYEKKAIRKRIKKGKSVNKHEAEAVASYTDTEWEQLFNPKD